MGAEALRRGTGENAAPPSITEDDEVLDPARTPSRARARCSTTRSATGRERDVAWTCPCSTGTRQGRPVHAHLVRGPHQGADRLDAPGLGRRRTAWRTLDESARRVLRLGPQTRAFSVEVAGFVRRVPAGPGRRAHAWRRWNCWPESEGEHGMTSRGTPGDRRTLAKGYCAHVALAVPVLYRSSPPVNLIDLLNVMCKDHEVPQDLADLLRPRSLPHEPNGGPTWPKALA